MDVAEVGERREEEDVERFVDESWQASLKP